MKFRVRFKNGQVTQASNFSLLPCGQVVGEAFFGNCDISGAKIELLVGQDRNGTDVYENDILEDRYGCEYLAGFDMNRGALIYIDGGKGSSIPFKYIVVDLFLKNEK